MNPAQEEELMAKIASMGKDMTQLSAEIKMIKSESKELVKSVNNTTDNKTIKDDNVMDTNDTLGLAALLKNDDKGADSMAAMWNNPWIYFVWMAMFANRGGCGGGGLFGGGGGGDCGESAKNTIIQTLGDLKGMVQCDSMGLQNLANNMAQLGLNQNFNKDTILSAIRNNSDEICACCSTLQMALCNNEKETLNRLYNIEVSAMQNAQMLASKIDQCCCQTNLNIERSFNMVDKSILNQNAAMAQGFCGVEKQILGQNAMISNGLSNLGYQTQNQFCELRFQNAQDKADIIQAAHADRDAILSWLTNDKIESLQEKLAAASAEIGRRDQSAYIISQLQTANRGCGCGCYSSPCEPGMRFNPWYVQTVAASTPAA